MSEMGDLKRTGFAEVHERMGAKMVPFAGFLMPIHYGSITGEHRAVRERVGVFDVSHMGEFLVEGPVALESIQRVTVNDASTLAVSDAQYSAMVNEDGGIVDDCVVYRLGEDRFMLVVNAANIDKDRAHVDRHRSEGDVTVTDRSETTSLLAVQGPRAEAVVSRITSVPISDMAFYATVDGELAGVPATISRTGYTGEDGFELYFDREASTRVWEALFEAGAEDGIAACGLGARDTLRLEMKYALYGQDIDETTNPYEAGLGWIVKLDKDDFVGRAALVDAKRQGVARRLVGFRMLDRAIPRPGGPIAIERERVSEVRSGAIAPSLGYGIGTCYLPPERATAGQPIAVVIRDQHRAAEVVKTPFYTTGSLRR